MSRPKLAFIFPGQGTQRIGMGLELAKAFPEVGEVFAAADAALGENLSELCFHGPEELLRQTVNAQPAILTASVAFWRLVSGHFTPDCVAGHSLGEYSALVAAGSLELAEAVRLVRERGRLMEEAVPPGTGTMAAIIGLEKMKVLELCREVAESEGLVEPATYNGGGQVVVAGLVPAVRKLMELALQSGAKRAVPLNVSGPFHSGLLQTAAAGLEKVLQNVRIAPPRCPIYANATACPVLAPDEIRRALTRQVCSAVLWEDCVEAMWRDGVRVFVEIGPGTVLSGLVRRIRKEAQCLHVEDGESWNNLLEWAKRNDVI